MPNAAPRTHEARHVRASGPRRPAEHRHLHRRRQPQRAESFVAELEARTVTIGERPLSFPAKDAISPGLRGAIHGRYLILFRDLDDHVRIVRILHGARDAAALLDAFNSTDPDVR